MTLSFFALEQVGNRPTSTDGAGNAGLFGMSLNQFAVARLHGERPFACGELQLPPPDIPQP